MSDDISLYGASIEFNQTSNQTKCQFIPLLNITNFSYRYYGVCVINFYIGEERIQKTIHNRYHLYARNLQQYRIITIRRHAQNEILNDIG